MKDVLKLMIKYENPINIATKSNLILRDLDLISKLSKITYVNIAFTITCADEAIQKIIELHASSSLERMKALQILKQKTNADVGILMMPVIPYITDSYANIKAIYKLDLDYIIPGTMYLKGKTKSYFLNSIAKYDYEVYLKINALYIKGTCSKEYKNIIYQRLNKMRKKHQL